MKNKNRAAAKIIYKFRIHDQKISQLEYTTRTSIILTILAIHEQRL